MTTVRRALVISFIERYALIIIALAGNILVARLLTPEQIGLYSVSLAVIGIAQVLRDFGVGTYLIQEKSLDDSHVRAAFGVSLLLGSILFSVIAFAAPSISALYGRDDMVGTLQICAINFLVLPFCTISLALLRREMQFQKVLYVTLIATLIGFCATIYLAYTGIGTNSMAIGAVITNVFTGFGAWAARGMKKTMMPSLVMWRAVVSFGVQRSAASIAGTLPTDMAEMATGKILGFASVALLSRAQGLMNLFQRDLLAAIVNVAYPAFAKAHREGKDLESLHVFSVGAITAVGWPFFGFLAMFSIEILRLLFGSQWDTAARFVPLYCLAGAIAAPTYLIIPVLTALGRIDVATKIDLVVQPLRAMLFIGGLILFPAIDTPPLLFIFAATCATPYYYLKKQKALPTHRAALFRVLTQSAIVTLGAMAMPLAICLSNAGRNSAIELPWIIVAGISSLIGWFLSLYAVNHPIIRDTLFLGIQNRLVALFGFK